MCSLMDHRVTTSPGAGPTSAATTAAANTIPTKHGATASTRTKTTQHVPTTGPLQQPENSHPTNSTTSAQRLGGREHPQPLNNLHWLLTLDPSTLLPRIISKQRRSHRPTRGRSSPILQAPLLTISTQYLTLRSFALHKLTIHSLPRRNLQRQLLLPHRAPVCAAPRLSTRHLRPTPTTLKLPTPTPPTTARSANNLRPATTRRPQHLGTPPLHLPLLAANVPANPRPLRLPHLQQSLLPAE